MRPQTAASGSMPESTGPESRSASHPSHRSASHCRSRSEGLTCAHSAALSTRARTVAVAARCSHPSGGTPRRPSPVEAGCRGQTQHCFHHELVHTRLAITAVSSGPPARTAAEGSGITQLRALDKAAGKRGGAEAAALQPAAAIEAGGCGDCPPYELCSMHRPPPEAPAQRPSGAAEKRESTSNSGQLAARDSPGCLPRVSRLGSTASWEERFLAAAERLPPWGNWLPGAVRHQRPPSCSWNRLEELRNEGSWRRRCTSTRWTDRALAKWPRGAVPRSASAISVPLPGPSSTTLCAAGDALSRWTETTAHVQLAVWGGLCCSRRLVIAASCA